MKPVKKSKIIIQNLSGFFRTGHGLVAGDNTTIRLKSKKYTLYKRF